MKTRTEQILEVLNVLAWVTFISLMIQTGGTLISYGASIFNPEAAKDLYRGLNLYSLRQYNFGHYTATVAFMVALIILKGYIARSVIQILSRIKLASPFTVEISRMVERVSYYILGLWTLTLLYNGYTAWLSKSVEGLRENWISGEFILLAGVVFLFAQIFKKGVEIQSENELTV